MTARILIIAGSDSGGGAGIQADVKTVTMLGGHTMTAITAITAQNTLGVQAVHLVPTAMVIAQIDSVVSDIGVDAIKIGMIGSAETANAVAERLERLSVPIIFDPVMIATSGSVLADGDTIAAFERLMRIATLTTPNLPELEALGGKAALFGPTLIKGGHSEGDMIIDRLVSQTREIARWAGTRIDTTSTHGTGCTLASAIACLLGQKVELVEAIAQARQFVRLALHGAPRLGSGHGPMGQGSVRADALGAAPLLNQITLGSSDYAVSVAFYKALGLRQIVDSPGNGYARFETSGGTTLSIHGGAAASSATTLYFESARLDDWVAELVAQGLVFDQMPTHESWLWREGRLRDPHGNIICLYHAGENRRYPPWRV
ncbi:MAG: bifunctional hydroxymethylpyrimidine kinase/phosphomethylpyrimidine kinase [Pseudomonadota bacterium]